MHLFNDPLLLLVCVEDLQEGLVDVRLVLKATLVTQTEVGNAFIFVCTDYTAHTCTHNEAQTHGGAGRGYTSKGETHRQITPSWLHELRYILQQVKG